jgi:hypothetical protein
VRVRFPRIAFLFVCTVSLALPLAGQSPNGTINGRVLDPSNKVIGGADILVISDATGAKYSGKTNDDGIYVVPNLLPGTYRLQVSKLGFKTLIKPDIVLNIQDALSINFTLPIGAVFEIVTVSGGASLVNTESASVSTVVDQTYVKNMPLNGRSFQDLILLTPGTVTQTPQANPSTSGVGLTGEVSVNGQRPESNYYMVDGVSANVGASSDGQWTAGAGISGSLQASTALGGTQGLVSVDDLQEFRVQSSTYSAEYGRSPGGQFAFETKSGTNQWHGSAYEYLRNGAFDAPDWFNDYFGVKATALRQNDFGGTLGGPVEVPGLYQGKDKTFLFFSYEGLRLAAPQAAVASFVPDLCMRGSGVCPLGRKPAATALQPVIQAYPLPSPNGLEDATNGDNQFIGSWSNPGSIDSTSIRLDHVVNDRLKVFFRFGDTGSSLATRRPAMTAPPTFVTAKDYTLRTYTAGVSNILTNRLGNEFRVNYSSNEAIGQNETSPFGGSSPLNLLQLSGLGPQSGSDVYLFLGSSTLVLSQAKNSGTQSQWNLVDTVTLSTGRHQVRLGGDFRRLAPSGLGPDRLAEYYFFSESAVESNTPYIDPTSIVPAVYPLYKNFSVFVQDAWRMSQRLNLSWGLRWEVNPAPGVTQGVRPYAIQGSGPSTWTLASQGTPLWRTTWYNFAPRFGAAYVLSDVPGRETVVRGGGGVFFDTGQQSGSSVFFAGPGLRADTFQSGGSFPNPGSYPPLANPPVPPFGVMYAIYPHLQLPYTLQWNGSVEQSLGKSQVFTMSYVGSHGVRLLQRNQLQVPLASYLQITQNGLTSDYGSLQMQFRRRLTRGLTALASYTWSHCIDYGSQNYLFAYQRGNCDFDVRHNLSAALSYDLPDVANNRFATAILHHWGFDDRLIVHTSFPVTLNGATLVQPGGQSYFAGLNLVPDQPVYLYGANCDSVLQGLGDLAPGQECPGGRAINPQAFTNVSSGLGTAPRNFARGFGAWQTNMAVRRDFRIHERLKLQFRAEAFNVFNHPNFGTINANFGQTTFGQATGTLANSLSVLNPLYQTGGPRSMQFALKLVF